MKSRSGLPVFAALFGQIDSALRAVQLFEFVLPICFCSSPAFQPCPSALRCPALQATGKAPTTKQRRIPPSPKPVMALPPPPSDSPDPTALKWAAKNPWFGTNLEMTYFAYEVHDQLIEEEHITADMPEYYTIISARVEAQFPDRFFPPGPPGMQRQGSVVLAGGRVGSNTAPMYRQASTVTPAMYRQGSVVGPAAYLQDLSSGPTAYRQASPQSLQQLPGGNAYAPRLYRGSSTVAAWNQQLQQQQDQQDQLGHVAFKGPVVPALPLSQSVIGEVSPRLAGTRSDRGVGSLYGKKTGTPRVDAASPRSDLGDWVAADMAWATGQRADMA